MPDQENPVQVEDHLSKLPDDVLSFVLSFLTMKDAVKTRLLSRRWRHLSSSSSNLRFDLLSVIGVDNSKYEIERVITSFAENKSKFIMGVSQFLQFYTGPRISTLKVVFALGNESASYIDEWFRFAMQMGATKISLNLSYRLEGFDQYDFPLHLLPHNKLSQLKHLRLKSCVLTPSPPYIKYLNSLMTLRIGEVPLSQCHLDGILSGCLNLEFLKLKRCELPTNVCIIGPLPRLKSLIFDDCTGCGTMEIPYLEKLNVFEHSWNTAWFKFNGIPALKTVYLGLLNRSGWGTRYVFNQLAEVADKLEHLSLNFVHFKVPLVPERMTAFRHLKQLVMFVRVSSRYDLNMVHILNACPALEKFQFSYQYTHDPEFTRAERLDSKNPHLHLKIVEIHGLKDRSNEMDLIMHLLKNCVALEELILHSKNIIILGAGRWREGGQAFQLDREAVRDALSERNVNSRVKISFNFC